MDECHRCGWQCGVRCSIRCVCLAGLLLEEGSSLGKCHVILVGLPPPSLLHVRRYILCRDTLLQHDYYTTALLESAVFFFSSIHSSKTGYCSFRYAACSGEAEQRWVDDVVPRTEPVATFTDDTSPQSRFSTEHPHSNRQTTLLTPSNPLVDGLQGIHFDRMAGPK